MSKQEATLKNLEGLKLLRVGKYDEAVTLFSESTEMDSTYPAPWLNRSETNRKLGRGAEAEADMEKWRSLTGRKQGPYVKSDTSERSERQRRILLAPPRSIMKIKDKSRHWMVLAPPIGGWFWFDIVIVFILLPGVIIPPFDNWDILYTGLLLLIFHDLGSYRNNLIINKFTSSLSLRKHYLLFFRIRRTIQYSDLKDVQALMGGNGRLEVRLNYATECEWIIEISRNKKEEQMTNLALEINNYISNQSNVEAYEAPTEEDAGFWVRAGAYIIDGVLVNIFLIFSFYLLLVLTLDPEEQAERILANLKRNREKSFGFGKRKWLTSRVTCGLCGHRYNLRRKNGCACLRSDPVMAQPSCRNIKIPWHKLSFTAWDIFIQCMTSFEALELCVKDKRRAWKAQKVKIERQVKILEEQVSRLQQKRRQYSWQQAEGIITEEELRTAYKQIQSEEIIINEQLARLEKFKHEPAPLDVATFKKIAEYWTCDIASDSYNSPDDVKARFAEMFDLQVTIHPDNTSQDGYHLNLSANIPLEMEGDKPSGYDMVFSPLGRGLGG